LARGGPAMPSPPAPGKPPGLVSGSRFSKLLPGFVFLLRNPRRVGKYFPLPGEVWLLLLGGSSTAKRRRGGEEAPPPPQLQQNPQVLKLFTLPSQIGAISQKNIASKNPQEPFPPPLHQLLWSTRRIW